MIDRIAALVATTIVATTTARAEPRDELAPLGPELEEAPILRPLAVPLVTLETLSVLVPAMTYYWSTTPVQREDFEMGWDWPSWKTKLTAREAFILDTNDWVANALRHPLAGYLTYGVGRTNGYGPVTSVALAGFAGASWEYLVEYQERISINDLVVNTLSAFLIGEPMFQLGRLGDAPGASWSRQHLALLASPYHRVHVLRGYASWRAPGRRWTQLEATVGAAAGTYDGDLRGDARLALDLEVVTDRRYGRPGQRSSPLAAGAWNRVVGDLRFLPTELSSVRFASQTIYRGWYRRDIDVMGTGTDASVSLAAGADYLSQRLAREWDQLFAMHLLGPRVTVGWWSAGLRVSWELAGYGDVGMIYAHAFGPGPAFEALPQINALQARGYYYATGVSLGTRLRADTPRWSAELESSAFQMWSIDGLDRVEYHGMVPADPHDITDQRLFGRASFGVRIDDAGTRIDIAAEAAVRSGTWQDVERWTTELAARTGVVFPF